MGIERSEEFVSFDGQERASGIFVRPDRYRQLENLLASRHPIVPRGAGLNYCLASGGHQVKALSMELFNRILEFSAEGGWIRVEAGLRLHELLDFTIKRGFWLPVLPGHPQITVGGCVAMNVHGKSQIRHGHFRDHVLSIKLMHPKMGELQCSQDENSEIFAVTIGGLGLTGLVTEVVLKLEPLTGRSWFRQRLVTNDLVEAADQMRELGRENWDFIYSWHDLGLFSKGTGEGFIFAERLSEKEVKDKFAVRPLRVNDRNKLIYSLLSPFASRLAPKAYRVLESCHKEKEHLGLREGAFPMNGKEFYFHFFGARGFREYQVIVPFETWKNFVSNLTSLLKNSPVPITLASLKIFDGRDYHLDFTRSGVCLAIDVPAVKASDGLWGQLDNLTLKYGGLPNISKDSRLSAQMVEATYPGYESFKKTTRELAGPETLNSSLRDRIDV